MTERRRAAPNPEWVQMYRQGVPVRRIAALARVAGSSVRYHLALAKRQDPGLAEAHQQLLPRAPRTTTAGRTNLAEILSLFHSTGRLPSAVGTTVRERSLASWLHDRRQEANSNSLSPAYADQLATIPGWAEVPSKKERDETRWATRFAELVSYRAEGNDWPRHNKTTDPYERQLGLWLHGQRITARASKLEPRKAAMLDTTLPGWRAGRKHRNRGPQA
ncbi:helicase associated domain-containing protein (plasmid) [Arthrobacter sp. G.S.26]|uniref:helicase associated domain-containing protein n=1 Tax=Arthrobacter sp. G.S.26 TaxID=3433706 RepID=UPI003D77C224